MVVDFGDGAHGGPGVARTAAPFDSHGRGEAADLVYVGFLHQVEELSGVGGEGFHVAALPFGVDGVEGKRGLARPGGSGDDHEPVPRDIQVDPSQIVLSGAAEDDAVFF